MELSVKDRLILINQFLILEKLYPESALPYSRLITALKEGYALSYHSMDDWIDPEGLDLAQCREVHEILEMFRALTLSLGRLKDRSGIDEGAVAFDGFDGHEEAKLMGYARFVLDDEERFPELRPGAGDDFNSHRPMLDRYRRMLREWRACADRANLTRDDIRRITAA